MVRWQLPPPARGGQRRATLCFGLGYRNTCYPAPVRSGLHLLFKSAGKRGFDAVSFGAILATCFVATDARCDPASLMFGTWFSFQATRLHSSPTEARDLPRLKEAGLPSNATVQAKGERKFEYSVAPSVELRKTEADK